MTWVWSIDSCVNVFERLADETSDEESSAASEDEPMETNEQKSGELAKLSEYRKQFLIGKIKVGGEHDDKIVETYVDYESAELIARYLASKRSFSRSFDVYLKQVITTKLIKLQLKLQLEWLWYLFASELYCQIS
jgi:hypothetical protein